MPEGEEEKQEIENLFEKIIKENCSNMAKEIEYKSRMLRESQASGTQRGTQQGTS